MSHPIIDRLKQYDLLRIDDRCVRQIVRFVGQELRDLDYPNQDEEWVRQRRAFLTQGWEDDFFVLSEMVESPIEQLLGAILLCITDGYNSVSLDIAPGAFPDPEFGTFFRCQNRLYAHDFHLGRRMEYRADFLFKVNLEGDYRALVVEVDGHDFHERTKQQAAYDRSRDRALTRRGIAVVRFTGSEVYRNPEKCAREVESELGRLTQELLHAHGKEIKPRPPEIPND